MQLGIDPAAALVLVEFAILISYGARLLIVSLRSYGVWLAAGLHVGVAAICWQNGWGFGSAEAVRPLAFLTAAMVLINGGWYVDRLERWRGENPLKSPLTDARSGMN